MVLKQDGSSARLDDAARAGWLYYVAGNTQDEIARKLGVSRQTAQRLVSMSVSEGLIKVRLDHPIGHCMDLAARLADRYGLQHVEVVPTDPDSQSATLGVAEAGAAELERRLRATDPQVIAIGTGRTLKAVIDRLPTLEAPQHKIVSLTGSFRADGSAHFYNVIFNLSDKVNARSFPMPLPVIVASAADRGLLHAQATIRSTMDLAARADLAFVGIGEVGPRGPLHLDGFLTDEETSSLLAAGAVGEIVGWTFDGDGELIDTPIHDRVASCPIPSRDTSPVIAIAMGEAKLAATQGALRGRLINGLITDERTAGRLIA